jgi:hypothetical protein
MLKTDHTILFENCPFFAKNSPFFSKIVKIAESSDHKLVSFKMDFYRRKLVKIAEKINHNIDIGFT